MADHLIEELDMKISSWKRRRECSQKFLIADLKVIANNLLELPQFSRLSLIYLWFYLKTRSIEVLLLMYLALLRKLRHT